MKNKIFYTCFLLLFIFSVNSSYAKIWLPSILSNNVVLQQNSTVTIWGWTTNAHEEIKVVGSWDNSVVSVLADQGVWSVQLSTPKAGGPYKIVIKGHEEISIKNVLIGEVWICSGQSNMEWTPKRGLLNSEEEIKNANYSNIRFFNVITRKSSTPQDDLLGNWVECSPESMKDFSSVAYFFGRKLHKDLSVPIGLVNSSWGGTSIETWTRKELIESDEELQNSVKKLSRSYWRPSKPGLAYNAMINPIINFNIAGVIWYQGETNHENANSYYKLFPLLINSWREVWEKDFPFYFVQLAPYDYRNEKNIDAAVVRDAQLQTMLKVTNTGMAVTNDIGNINNIHPINKQEVGRRLALWALAKTYGVKDVEFSGPIYKSMKIKKKKIILSFDYVNTGLIKKGKELVEFEIAGSDKKFYKAKAKIIGKTVVVSSTYVKNPVAVRFAFSNTAEPNLYNKAGLPASAFRTDNWKIELE